VLPCGASAESRMPLLSCVRARDALTHVLAGSLNCRLAQAHTSASEVQFTVPALALGIKIKPASVTSFRVMVAGKGRGGVKRVVRLGRAGTEKKGMRGGEIHTTHQSSQ